MLRNGLKTDVKLSSPFLFLEAFWLAVCELRITQKATSIYYSLVRPQMITMLHNLLLVEFGCVVMCRSQGKLLAKL